MKKYISIGFSVLLMILITLTVVFADEKIDLNTPSENEGMISVYVSDTGSDDNDGTTAAKAFKTLNKAYDSLSQTGGIIVISGKITLEGENPSFPINEKPIEITSYYDGTDYRSKNGAEFLFSENLHINGNAQTYFYGVKFHSKKKANIFCNGSDVRFGSRIESVSDDEKYPSIYGGTYLTDSDTVEKASFSSFTLTVDAGYWHHVTLGNMRSSANAPLGNISDATLNITGGTYIASDSQNDHTSAVSGAKSSGKININISGGIFYGSVYAIGYEGEILSEHDLYHSSEVFFTIKNGSFLGKYIKALYSKNARLLGEYNFKAEQGSFNSLVYVGCEGVVGKISLDSCESIQNKLYGFEKVIYVSSTGDDEKSGESPQSAKRTLSGAFAALRSGGTVVICSKIELPNGFITRKTDQKIRITSLYYDEDYTKTNDAKLVIDGNISLGSDIIFENIIISAKNPATLLCHGENTRFGRNIRTEGDVAVNLTNNTRSHSLEIASGKYSFVSFESSDITTYISFTGGTIDLFRGCTEMHQGDIFVDFSGGIINNDINIAPKGVVGNLQLIIGNAQIKGSVSTLRPDDDKRCEALVVYNYDKSKLAGFDIIEDNYVFVKDGADGNGSTPSNAAGDLNSAYKYLGNTNATVVFCGKYTHNTEHTPYTVGVITYTSIYRNIDFQKINSAEIILYSDFHFDNDATIENVTLDVKSKDLAFCLNSHIVIFGESIVCNNALPYRSYFPSILSNNSVPQSPYDQSGISVSDKIIIKGGVWNNVYGSAAVEVLGGVIKGAVYGTNDLSVNSCIEISGGVIYGGIYASFKAKENSESHIIISLAGGKVYGLIAPSKYSSVGYTGKYLLNITYADLSGVDSIYDASYIGGDRSYANVLDEIDMSLVPDVSASYQNPISDKMSSLVYYNGYYYLSVYEDRRINIYKSSSIGSINSSIPVVSIDKDLSVNDLTASVCNGKIYLFADIITSAKKETVAYMLDLENISSSLVTIPFGTDYTLGSPSVISIDDKIYLFYSKKDVTNENIYCVEVDAALNHRSEPVMVISAGSKWENNYISSPRIIGSKDALYLLFTGGNIYGESSMIGISKIIADDILNPESYEKNPDPIFYETSLFTNINLKSLIIIDEHKEPYFVFSARYNGLYSMFMQSFSFDSNGVPYLGTPVDIKMEYIHYQESRSLDSLLTSFKINVTDEVPIEPIIPQKATIFDILQNNSILLVCTAFVIIFIIILVLIKKYSQNPKTQFKKNQKQRTRNERKRASRLKTGRAYAANLERIDTQANNAQLNADKDVSSQKDQIFDENTTDAIVQSTSKNDSVYSVDNVTFEHTGKSDRLSDVELKEKTEATSETKSSDLASSDDASLQPGPKKRPRPSRRI